MNTRINLLRPADLRARLKVCNTTLYKLIARGDLPAPKKLGRSSVWRESEIAAALDRLLGAEELRDGRS